MKIYIGILIAVSMLFFNSCDSWLDIQQEGEMEAGHLYSAGEGYRAVLNGLYKEMGSTSLYGKELSFGMVDCMSQQYDLSSDKVNANDMYRAFQGFKYLDNNVRDVIDKVWLSAFKVIANANDLIQSVKDAPADIFQKGELEKNLIMGEAYACRALMHFDMLRLFAPALVNDDQETYVPYVEVYPNILATSIQVKPFLNKVLDDLRTAKELVIQFDTTSVGVKANCSGSARFSDSNDHVEYETFFFGRGYRLNYYAITALQARVYQYANMDKEAFDCAKEVLEFENKGKAFYTDDFSGVLPGGGSDINAFNGRTDFKTKSNLIFAVYNEKEYKDAGLGSIFRPKAAETGGSQNYYFMVRRGNLFKSRQVEEWTLDLRSTKLIFVAQENYPVSGRWYVPAVNAEGSEHLKILPVIRLTEMRYIMAEYYAKQGQFNEAYSILNDIRESRNLSRELTIQNSFAEFVTDLIEDARREWISEGQLFYLYKRLDANYEGLDGRLHRFTKAEACLPLPTDQK